MRLSDVERSQELADSFERVDCIHVLGRYALRVNPLLRQGEVLDPMQYYSVTAQSEYSTDILFRKRADQREVELRGTRMPGRRVKHRMKFNWIKTRRSKDHVHRYDQEG